MGFEYITVSLICISLRISDMEPLFVCFWTFACLLQRIQVLCYVCTARDQTQHLACARQVLWHLVVYPSSSSTCSLKKLINVFLPPNQFIIYFRYHSFIKYMIYKYFFKFFEQPLPSIGRIYAQKSLILVMSDSSTILLLPYSFGSIFKLTF